MRDPQTVLAATFDLFFFFDWFGIFFFISGFFFFFFYFFFFILASMSLGTGKKNAALADRYGPTNSVKNIEWWKLGDNAKRVWKIEWWVMSYELWVMSDEWWKLSDKKNEAKQPLSFWYPKLSPTYSVTGFRLRG